MKYLFVGQTHRNIRTKEHFKRLIFNAGIREEEYEFAEEVKAAEVVIPYGEVGLVKVLGRKDIQNCRGSIYEKEGQKIIPIVDPEKIFAAPWYTAAIINDLRRAREVGTGIYHIQCPKLSLCTTSETVEKWFSNITAGGYCAFDIETTLYGGEWIKCIGFACSEDEGIVVPFPQGDGAGFLELVSTIKKWMTSGEIKWIGQNGYNFDIPYMSRNWGFSVNNYWIDTMVLHHMLYPEFPHDLATISSFYTLIPYYKDTSDKDLYQYNCNDAVATYISAMKMIEEAEKSKCYEIYRNYYHPLLTPLRIIHERGVRIDKAYQGEIKNVLKKDIKELQEELDTIYKRYTNTDGLQRRLKRVRCLSERGRKTVYLRGKRKRLSSMVGAIEKQIVKKGTLNVRSTKELAAFLYQTLALPVKTKRGKVTTDETALNQLFIKTQHPFLKTMIKLRQKRNMMSRWGLLKTDENGMITTSYSFAESGRLRSGKFEGK